MRLAPWAGPALPALGLAGIIALSLQPPHERSALAWWLLTNALAYERVLPLVGLGAVLALVNPRQCATAFAFFTLGIVLGFAFATSFLSAIALVPASATISFSPDRY